jgi:hypothetical protein
MNVGIKGRENNTINASVYTPIETRSANISGGKSFTITKGFVG